MSLRTLMLGAALFLGACVALATLSSARADDTGLHWQWGVEPNTVKAGDDAEIVFSAVIPRD